MELEGVTQGGCHFSDLGPGVTPEHWVLNVGREEPFESPPAGVERVITHGHVSQLRLRS